MVDELIQWSVAAEVHQGEEQSGDHHFIKRLNGSLLIGAIDGLGHGQEAAEASRAVVAVLEAHCDQPLESLFRICHKGLAGTRGVVMTLASLNSVDQSLTWAGVGNVEGRLLRADKESSHPEETLLLRSGVVGYNLPSTLTVSTLQIFGGDVLILATDGIRADFATKLHIGRSAYQIANDILARHAKGTDDALVVVARYRGGRGQSET
jgi:negative regulator of sigma-B (phosphoserine phosphatase)